MASIMSGPGLPEIRLPYVLRALRHRNYRLFFFDLFRGQWGC
jgi:hypothetical protein